MFVETVKKPTKNDVNASNKEDLTGLGGAPSAFSSKKKGNRRVKYGPGDMETSALLKSTNCGTNIPIKARNRAL